jgi:hypothetical protein
MATYRTAADPYASSRSALAYLAIGLVAGVLGVTAAFVTYPVAEDAPDRLADAAAISASPAR